MFKVPKIGSWYYFCNILRKKCRNYFWVLLRCKTFRYLKSVLSFSLLLVLVRLFSFFSLSLFLFPSFFFREWSSIRCFYSCLKAREKTHVKIVIVVSVLLHFFFFFSFTICSCCREIASDMPVDWRATNVWKIRFK